MYQGFVALSLRLGALLGTVNGVCVPCVHTCVSVLEPVYLLWKGPELPPLLPEGLVPAESVCV